MTSPAPEAPAPGTPPSLVATSTVVARAHLTWLAWTWIIASTVFAVIIALIVRAGGELDSSLWHSAMASWQRYVIFAAGVTTLPSLLAMFVSNGVTRSQLSASSTVSMVAVALAGTAWVVVGFTIERLVFEGQGWSHLLNGDQPVESGGALALLGVRYLLIFCLWFTAGWIIGATFYRYGFIGGVASIIPAAIPVLVCELLVGQGSATITVDVLAGVFETPAVLAVLVGVGLVAANATVARAITRGAAVRSC